MNHVLSIHTKGKLGKRKASAHRNMETFTQALAVILREVRLAEFIDLACVRDYGSDCTTIYARECGARHMTPERYHYLYAHYGELWKQRIVGRFSIIKGENNLRTVNGLPVVNWHEFPFWASANTVRPEIRGAILRERGYLRYERRRSTYDNNSRLELPHSSARLFDMTHVTVFYKTDRPLGHMMNITIRQGHHIFKTYRFVHRAHAHVRIPILDGYVGILLNGWIHANEALYLESNDLCFDDRYIVTGRAAFANPGAEDLYRMQFGDIAHMPFLMHPRYTRDPDVPEEISNNQLGYFTGTCSDVYGDGLGNIWNRTTYMMGSFYVHFAPAGTQPGFDYSSDSEDYSDSEDLYWMPATPNLSGIN